MKKRGSAIGFRSDNASPYATPEGLLPRCGAFESADLEAGV